MSLTLSHQNVQLYTFSVQTSILLNFPPPPYLSNGSSESPIRRLALFIILEIGFTITRRNLSNFTHICCDYPRCTYYRLYLRCSAENCLSTDTLNQHWKTSTLLTLVFILLLRFLEGVGKNLLSLTLNPGSWRVCYTPWCILSIH